MKTTKTNNFKTLVAAGLIAGLAATTLAHNVDTLVKANDDSRKIEIKAEVDNTKAVSADVVEKDSKVFVVVKANADVSNAVVKVSVDGIRYDNMELGSLAKDEVREIELDMPEAGEVPVKTLPNTAAVSDSVDFSKEVQGHKVKGSVSFVYDNGVVDTVAPTEPVAPVVTPDTPAMGDLTPSDIFGTTPVEPAKPVAPVVTPDEPVNPVIPAVTPVEPAKPVVPVVTPAEPTKPVEPAKPLQPVIPDTPDEPVVTPEKPAKPVAPVVTPAEPVNPVTPAEPTKPVEPAKPVTPVVTPAEPTQPVAPVVTPADTGLEAGMPANVKWSRAQLKEWGFTFGKITGDYKVDGDLGVFDNDDALDPAYRSGRAHMLDDVTNGKMDFDDFSKNTPHGYAWNSVTKPDGTKGYAMYLYGTDRQFNDGQTAR